MNSLLQVENFLSMLSDEDILFVHLQRFSLFMWVIAILQFYIMELAPCTIMNALTMHGKLGSFIVSDNKLQFLMVPKSFFVYFYLLGFLLSVCLITYLVNVYFVAEILQTVTAVVLFSIHCWRRYLECLYITAYGDSKVHALYWLGGMGHYILVNTTFLVAALEERQRAVGLSESSTIITAFSIYIFSSILQFHSHSILHQLKLSMSKKKENEYLPTTPRYPLPKGGGFNYCVCPHYLAEIGIYFSFIILTNWSISSWLMLLWVICNLSYTASQHYSYYITNHSEELEKRRLSVLFPSIW